MNALIYYLILPFLYLIAILPHSLFYLLSDLVFVIVYRIAGYRKKIVRKNLENAFPEKTTEERRKIEKDFYVYLCDFMLETLKTLTFTKRSALQHCSIAPEAKALFDHYYEKKQSLIIVMGHFGNWEWGGNAFSLSCKQPLHVVYHPLANPYFDRLLYRMRTRFGTGLIKMKESSKVIPVLSKQLTAIVLIADQAPRPENAYWTQFLNQDTPVYWGPERIAKKLDLPVIYMGIYRIRRGKYEIRVETLMENPSLSAEGEITELHTRKLEADVIRNPELWLWSHKRWKHKRPNPATVV
jgi:KDO2-lipid IV(A) lauroyltransferase